MSCLCESATCYLLGYVSIALFKCFIALLVNNSQVSRHAAYYGASSHYGSKRQILAFFGHSELSLPLGEVWVKVYKIRSNMNLRKMEFQSKGSHMPNRTLFFFSSSIQPKFRIAKRRELIPVSVSQTSWLCDTLAWELLSPMTEACRTISPLWDCQFLPSLATERQSS